VTNRGSLVLVDAHVHIYDCFELDTFFDAAYSNFRSHAERLGQPRSFVGLLLLSEATGCDWFQRLVENAERPAPDSPAPGWTCESTGEAGTLLVRSAQGFELILIAGHQIVTAERLEVLALCCEERPEESLPLAETLQLTSDLGAVPVVAWGAGKWLGRRGTVLRRLLQDGPPRGMFLGDNAGRLGFWPRPQLFRVAERLGIRVLPGSDPLPFPSHASRAGRFGFWSTAGWSASHPARSLKELLSDPGFVPHPYGALARPFEFALDQAAMQARSRYRRAAPGS
jgi:hypothetical protein